MSKSCDICNKELGFGSKKCELKDGLVCAECVKKAGLVSRKNLKGLTIEALKKGIEKNNKMLARQQIFKPTSEVGTYLKVDDNNKMFMTNDLLFNYDNLVSYELIEDGSSLTKSGLGQAVVGGVLFGGAGAVVGAITGQKQKETCNSLKILITLKDTNCTTVYIPFITVSVKKNGNVYQSAKGLAQNCVNLLTMIVSENNRKATASASVSSASGPIFIADELTKYKKLLDEGILTQEEFDAQKQKLLNQ